MISVRTVAPTVRVTQVVETSGVRLGGASVMAHERTTEPGAGGLNTPRTPLSMRPYPHYVCPRCRRIIQPDADRCAHCGQALGSAWDVVDVFEALEELRRPGTYAAIVLPGLAVVLACALVFGADSRAAKALGFGLLLGSQAFLSYCTYRLLREER